MLALVRRNAMMAEAAFLNRPSESNSVVWLGGDVGESGRQSASLNVFDCRPTPTFPTTY
jgi:hypothetical protein